ncbi:MAG: cellulase family glycosylhydrolase [Acidimicrobiia bacterium]
MRNFLTVGLRELRAELRTRDPRPRPPLAERARWSRERAARWAEETGWLVGCNFTPSTAGNQLELWQEATFDLPTIDRELGWASEQLGLNSARIFLHDLVWARDRAAFLDRVDAVLDAAAGHGIRTMLVLFDGVWDPNPRPGRQRDPRPGVHNSIWVQSPGAAVVGDPSRWPLLRRYVEAVIGRFGRDERVVMWDLFNEPDSPNPAYRRQEVRDKERLIARLVDQVFDWAVGVDPDQPLTVGLYAHLHRAPERARPASRVFLERSDVVTFHSYEPEDGLRATIGSLRRFGRPLVCTEWMARPRSPVALLEVFAAERIGCYCWGLVDGRTQTKHPWASWVRPIGPDRGWFHDLLHPDGTPYDPAEATLFRRVAGQRG